MRAWKVNMNFKGLDAHKVFAPQKHLLLYFGMIALFFPLYSTPNIGGTGLAATFNISTWIVASWGMSAGLLLIMHSKRFTVPRLWFFLIIFPIIAVISGFLADINQPVAWLFRVIYILGGLLFIFALFQFNLTERVIDHCLFIITIASGLHALIGIVQIFIPDSLPLWIPRQPGFAPRSLFQQINTQATFLTTSLIITLYLISRPSFRFSSLLVKTVIVIIFTLAVYVLVASGSRIGLLSLLLGIPLIIWSRYKALRFHKNLLIILFIASCCSFVAGQSGLHRTIDKMALLKENSYSSARIAMYTIGLELVSKSPIHGYGIGGFLSAWNKQASDFVGRHPETSMPEYILHPHKELLFWMIEGGLLALAGILAVVIGIGIALYRCGFQRGGAYAAMLLPISLHTQVEHPFYISSVHWFLWLFLIFLALRHQTKRCNVNLSLSATRLVQCVAIFLAIGVTLFMVNTTRAQTDLYNFLYVENPQPPHLQIALNNLYFKPEAEQIAMRAMLYSSILSKDTSKVEIFEKWAKDYVNMSPELKMYEDLISASIFLRPEGKGCDAIKAGLAMYAHNKPLQEASLVCLEKQNKQLSIQGEYSRGQPT